MKRLAADSFDRPAPDAADASTGRWRARLSLGFANDAGTTRMVERSHVGPLRVQKPLYPEGEEICHAIIVHPPGGVAGGDELTITAMVGRGAQTLLATPGAAKWYKANGRTSRQDVRLQIGDGATLEWLPQETIFFNDAQVELDNAIELGKDACYIGCEILCFGRSASGEVFNAGRVRQATNIRQAGKLVWFEQGILSDGSASPLALAGKTICATLIAVGKTLPPAVISSIREDASRIADPADLFGATQLKSVLVVRYLGGSSETARQLMIAAWRRLRPEMLGRDAIVPRIWNT